MPTLAAALLRPVLRKLNDFIVCLDSSHRRTAIHAAEVVRLTDAEQEGVRITHVWTHGGFCTTTFNSLEEWLEILVYGEDDHDD